MLLAVLAAPAMALDGLPSHLPASYSLHDRGWLVDPGFSGAAPGPYHDTWISDPYGPVQEVSQYTGVRHRFGSGLGLDSGIAEYGVERQPNRYREYYLGLSYDGWQGRVWYTDDFQGSGMARSHYELGVSGRVGEDLSLSARVGYGHDSLGLPREPHPSYVFSAQKRDLYGFGLNLQLMGSSDARGTSEDDLRVMGTLSRPLP